MSTIFRYLFPKRIKDRHVYEAIAEHDARERERAHAGEPAFPSSSLASASQPASSPLNTPYAFEPRPTLPFLLLGAAILLPWNTLLLTFPHFSSLLPPSSPLRSTLPSSLSTLATFTNFFALGWITFRPNLDTTTDATGETRRSLFQLLILQLLILIGVLASGGAGQSTGGWSWAVMAMLSGWTIACMVVGSCLQASVMQLSSLYGPSQVGATIVGQGAIAVALSSVQVISAVFASRPKEGDSPETKSSTAMFIFAGLIILLVTIVQFAKLVRSSAHQQALLSPSDLDPSLPPLNPQSSSPLLDNTNPVLAILRANAQLNLAIYFVFVVSLSVFPAVTSTVLPVSSDESWWKVAWAPIGFALFNLGDFAGRSLPSIYTLTSQSVLLICSAARILFVPFFVGCNTAGSYNGRDRDAMFGDISFSLGMLLLGLSGGYVSACAMITSSTPSLNPRISMADREQAGTIAVFCLISGLVVGSLSSFGVVSFL